MFIQFLRLDGRNNNSNKNIKLQIKSFLKKISLQLNFKRVNVPRVFKTVFKTVLNKKTGPFFREKFT